MKWGIFSRSTAGYLIVLFLLAVSNIYAIVKLDQFNTIILSSHSLDMRLLDVEKKLADAIFSQRRYEQKYLLTKDEALYDQFLAAKDDFNRYLAEMNSVGVSPSKKDALAKIRFYQKRYQALVDAEVKYVREDRNYTKDRFKTEKERAADAVLGELEKLQNYSREDVGYKTKMVGDVGAVARKVAVTSFLITVLLAIVLSFFITRSITKPLIKLVNKTREIPTGTFDCDFDVSAPPEIRELAEAFNLMCERLKEVDTMKTEFFSMISHELRTPLTTIKEGTSLLMEGAGGTLTQKQGKLLGIIAAESGRLAGLVNSILDLSKMEGGMMRYTFVRVSIPHLVEQAVTEIAPYAEAKRITVQTQIDAKVPPCRMDAERILEVLRNLIGNAVKFTPEGGRITVSANPVAGCIEVSVSDTGPGIPQEKLATVFDKYHSSDQKMGTGLGLAIAKHIVAAHGGKLWAESKPGAGSRFVFTLPA